MGGQAERYIEGFLLTYGNCTEGQKNLKERFGNTRLIIKTHVRHFLKVGIAEEGNVSKLHNFLDTVESHVWALNNQDINERHSGVILIPVI